MTRQSDDRPWDLIELEILRKLAFRVRRMREYQRAYFAHRKPVDLSRCRKLEAAVDAWVRRWFVLLETRDLPPARLEKDLQGGPRSEKLF